MFERKRFRNPFFHIASCTRNSTTAYRDSFTYPKRSTMFSFVSIFDDLPFSGVNRTNIGQCIAYPCCWVTCSETVCRRTIRPPFTVVRSAITSTTRSTAYTVTAVATPVAPVTRRPPSPSGSPLAYLELALGAVWDDVVADLKPQNFAMYRPPTAAPNDRTNRFSLRNPVSPCADRRGAPSNLLS